MTLQPVVSSNIQAIGYEAGVLVVEYRNGSMYRYEGVPESFRDAILSAESVGSALFRMVTHAQPRFAYRKLTDEECVRMRGAGT